MRLDDLLGDICYKLIQGNPDTNIVGIDCDSRRVKKGCLFVCIEGTKTDGHEYIDAACANGASAIAVTRDAHIPAGVAAIRIENGRRTLAYLSDRFYGHPSGKLSLIGITGTKGKTTISYMIKSILEKTGRKVGLIGTISNMIGSEILRTERTTPESCELQELIAGMKTQDVSHVVMEVSSQGLALDRVSYCDFETAVFTNLSRDHISISEHKDMDDYFKAKLRLFDMCRNAVINIDSAYGKTVLAGCRCKTVTYGIGETASVRAVNIETMDGSVSFDAVTPWFRGEITVNIPGIFTVYNSLAAIAVCGLSGIGYEDIRDGLYDVKVRGRAEVISHKGDFTVMVDYAHTSDSLENILTAMKSNVKGRLISVFGCGGDKDKGKRPLMGEVSGKLADYTVITSDNPRTEEPAAIVGEIEKGIKTTGGAYSIIIDRAEAIRHAINSARQGDVVVIAGKGHEPYQIFKDKIIHFDDCEIAREILGENNA